MYPMVKGNPTMSDDQKKERQPPKPPPLPGEARFKRKPSSRNKETIPLHEEDLEKLRYDKEEEDP